ncbi:MAG: hypothetical protein AB7P46_06010 [Thermoanaerobaculia bacterium]
MRHDSLNVTIVPRRGLTSLPLPETTPARPARLGRALLLAGIALAALLAWREATRWREMQQAIASTAVASGLAGEALREAQSDARREADPADADVALAAALLERELLTKDPTSPEAFERLRTAGELAGRALRAQPANYQAAMILGATVSLERSRARDTRLFSLSSEWERPLAAAMGWAPGAAAPRRLLAAAYLEGWQALSPAKRELAEGLLREAFRDPDSFSRLYPVWVEIAGSLDRAATLLPDEPRSWRSLAQTAYERRSWPDYLALTARLRRSLVHEFEEVLPQGMKVATAEATVSPRIFREVLTMAPVDGEFVPFVERVLSLRPPGAADEAESQAAATWFDWAAPLCLLRNCPLSGGAMARLASLAGPRLAPEQTAFAALAAGDSARADLLERRSDALWSEPWAPYFTLKAKQLAAKGDDNGARAALEQAHRAFRVRTAWRRLAETLLAPKTPSSVREASLAAAVQPAARAVWEASDWWFDRGATRLDLLPVRPAPALLFELSEAPREGALLEMQWDGRRLEPVWLPPGATSARVEIPAATAGDGSAVSGPGVTPEAHLLETRFPWGNLRPAMRVRLD